MLTQKFVDVGRVNLVKNYQTGPKKPLKNLFSVCLGVHQWYDREGSETMWPGTVVQVHTPVQVREGPHHGEGENAGGNEMLIPTELVT